MEYAVFQRYRKVGAGQEHCFNVEVSGALNREEFSKLCWLLAGTGTDSAVSEEPYFTGERVVEIGPRLNFATPYSTNAVAICRSAGLNAVTRIEHSRRLVLPAGQTADAFFAEHADRMTEMIYENPIASFEVSTEPVRTYELPIIENGARALEEVNAELGLGMDDWDINYYTELFTKHIKRNPTVVELFQLSQANSEHSRHWYFKGRQVIDGKEQAETLLEIVQSTLKENPSNSLVAFKDNSSVIKGFAVDTIMPKSPGLPASFGNQSTKYDFLLTAETHNFPTGIAPAPGAETGAGGRIRDVEATGRGGLVIAGTAGYCVGDLAIPAHSIPGEKEGRTYPDNLASPLGILIGASNGASDYGNKFGEPLIAGFTRTGELDIPLQAGLPNVPSAKAVDRRGWLKPIMFSGGIGQVDRKHLGKEAPERGMKIVEIGGPAYRIGIGGGSASSMMQGDNREELDFNAVQRGDAEMEQKMNRVIRACIEMGGKNPILSIHDQGAGGPCNVITEIVEPAGGKIDIRKINLGDKSMSVLEIWGGEYQERDALLVADERIPEFKQLCERERVPCEVLGDVTGDGKIIVYDSAEGKNHVDLELERILGKLPQKTFETKTPDMQFKPFDSSVLAQRPLAGLLKNVFALPQVGSKGFLVRKVDRSVTGFIAGQQCVGPLQLPIADYAVAAQSHFAVTGVATSIGEQPIKMLVDPAAGARMAVAEALTNIVGAGITQLYDVKCSLNWMWAPKLPGEGALMYEAAKSCRDIMVALGIAVDGGKDSLSMATKVEQEGQVQVVKSPGEMVVSTYAPVRNITKIITPDIKRPSESNLLHIDLASGKRRLGGSALAQTFGEVGNEVPDIDDVQMLKETFGSVLYLIDRGSILAIHDIGDGGLITTITEMVMAGNCGASISIENGNVVEELFAEEAGWVVEYLPEHKEEILERFASQKAAPQLRELGKTTKRRNVHVAHADTLVLNEKTTELLAWWESTSDKLEEKQMNIDVAREQAKHHARKGPTYNLTFTPKLSLARGGLANVPKVAVIREEGSNGDREMASAFYDAGFEVFDVSMEHLLRGESSLSDFRGVAFVGGFSYADVFGSARGWAGGILFNDALKKQFADFYQRPDTFSLGVCNGCQLMAQLGWLVPSSTLRDEPSGRDLNESEVEGVPSDSIMNAKVSFIQNNSERFESRFVTVRVNESPAVMLKGMEGSTLGIWVAHGEGRMEADKETLTYIAKNNLAPLAFVDDAGKATEKYPFNPNGSPSGLTALTSPDGRHLAMMPHPERLFRLWQWPWLPQEWADLEASPWLKLFQNALEWCDQR
jgi:phosphoribosylformylglycinamidine synthase